jgi:hypothetical protein
MNRLLGISVSKYTKGTVLTFDIPPLKEFGERPSARQPAAMFLKTQFGRCWCNIA